MHREQDTASKQQQIDEVLEPVPNSQCADWSYSQTGSDDPTIQEEHVGSDVVDDDMQLAKEMKAQSSAYADNVDYVTAQIKNEVQREPERSVSKENEFLTLLLSLCGLLLGAILMLVGGAGAIILALAGLLSYFIQPNPLSSFITPIDSLISIVTGGSTGGLVEVLIALLVGGLCWIATLGFGLAEGSLGGVLNWLDDACSADLLRNRKVKFGLIAGLCIALLTGAALAFSLSGGSESALEDSALSQQTDAVYSGEFDVVRNCTDADDFIDFEVQKDGVIVSRVGFSTVLSERLVEYSEFFTPDGEILYIRYSISDIVSKEILEDTLYLRVEHTFLELMTSEGIRFDDELENGMPFGLNVQIGENQEYLVAFQVIESLNPDLLEVLISEAGGLIDFHENALEELYSCIQFLSALERLSIQFP